MIRCNTTFFDLWSALQRRNRRADLRRPWTARGSARTDRRRL